MSSATAHTSALMVLIHGMNGETQGCTKVRIRSLRIHHAHVGAGLQVWSNTVGVTRSATIIFASTRLWLLCGVGAECWSILHTRLPGKHTVCRCRRTKAVGSKADAEDTQRTSSKAGTGTRLAKQRGFTCIVLSLSLSQHFVGTEITPRRLT